MPKKRYNAEEIIHKLRRANFLRVRRRISRTAASVDCFFVLVISRLSPGSRTPYSVSFHRVGAQDVVHRSPRILRSGRLLPFWLGGLELKPCARTSARASAEPLRAARSE